MITQNDAYIVMSRSDCVYLGYFSPLKISFLSLSTYLSLLPFLPLWDLTEVPR